MRLFFDHIHHRFWKEQTMSEQTTGDTTAGTAGSTGTATAGLPGPPDPRDATIAAQQAEIDRLTGELERVGVNAARSEGQVRADDAFDEQARADELQKQGVSEQDAVEQAAYEARLRADQGRQ